MVGGNGEIPERGANVFITTTVAARDAHLAALPCLACGRTLLDSWVLELTCGKKAGEWLNPAWMGRQQQAPGGWKAPSQGALPSVLLRN